MGKTQDILNNTDKAILSPSGGEIHNPKPIAIPIELQAPESPDDRFKRMMSQFLMENQQYQIDSPEDNEDFYIADDPVEGHLEDEGPYMVMEDEFAPRPPVEDPAGGQSSSVTNKPVESGPEQQANDPGPGLGVRESRSDSEEVTAKRDQAGPGS